MPRTALLVLALAALCGCQGKPFLVDDFKEGEAYQVIANALPDLSLGFSEPPSVIGLTRTRSIPEQAPAAELEVFCNEDGFKIRSNTLITRVYTIPYSAIVDIEYAYNTFPSVLFLILPVQSWEVRVVIDSSAVPEIRSQILKDFETMRSISREVSLPGPYFYAEEIKSRLDEVAQIWGKDRLELRTNTITLLPPFVPVPGQAKRVSEAFRWAQEKAKTAASADGEKAPN